MQRRRFCLLALLLAPLLSGCLYSREIAGTRRDIERAYPEARFDREMVVSLGPLSLRTISWITGMVDDEEARMARDYLRTMQRIKVGVYRTEQMPDLETLEMPELRRFKRNGWETALRFRDEGEMGWVFYRPYRDTVRDLYVVVFSEEELVLARVRGHLNELLARVMEDQAGFTDLVRLDRHD